ncbi:MAG TPA: photosystem reaction center subunit H [Cyanobacteria bacterium UBA8803]|nr:photosystem reaction center subunit H [Cyanobacteria bacterium UBA9273]HBL57061.1 photosystem reaction center subunit H [Cyanobacteria bacterium UBA8803]
MALVKIGNFYPDYKEDIFGGTDLKGFDVYTGTDEKIGSVYDILVDETGRFRYFVIDMGFWVFGKKVLLPIGQAQMDYDRHRVYVTGMTRDQAEQLPKYDDNMIVDYDYEEEVRDAYRPKVAPAATATNGNYNRDTYRYDSEPSLYGINEQNQQNLRLYEERLITNKERYQTGTVVVGKHIETETAQVSVPVEKERVIIERTSPSDISEVTPGSADFQEGEVVRMEVYEESVDIQKQPFVREEVSIKKEVERDTVEATETLRREELDVDIDGRPVVNQNP